MAIRESRIPDQGAVSETLFQSFVSIGSGLLLEVSGHGKFITATRWALLYSQPGIPFCVDQAKVAGSVGLEVEHNKLIIQTKLRTSQPPHLLNMFPFFARVTFSDLDSVAGSHRPNSLR